MEPKFAEIAAEASDVLGREVEVEDVDCSAAPCLVSLVLSPMGPGVYPEEQGDDLEWLAERARLALGERAETIGKQTAGERGHLFVWLNPIPLHVDPVRYAVFKDSVHTRVGALMEADERARLHSLGVPQDQIDAIIATSTFTDR